MAITLSKRSASEGSVLKRAGIILAIGLFLTGFPTFDLATWRIPGVLQRIAVCYAVVALILPGGDVRPSVPPARRF